MKLLRIEPPRQKFFEFLPPLRGRGMMEAVIVKIVPRLLIKELITYYLLLITYYLLLITYYLLLITYYLLLITYYLLLITYYLLLITYYLLLITYYLLLITYYLLLITYHLFSLKPIPCNLSSITCYLKKIKPPIAERLLLLPDFDSVFRSFVKFVSLFHIECFVESVNVDKWTKTSEISW